MEQSKIDRINALAKKSRKTSLTPAEQEEQAALRAEYLAAVRRNFRSTLESIRFAEDSGKKVIK